MRKAAIAIWLGCCALLRLAAAAEPPQNEWRHYLGSQDSSGYSSLAQINRSNVGQLQVAWSYSAGQNPRLRFNPIVVDGVMYVLGKNGSIVALDAASGKQLWSYEPDPLFARDVTDRGINYWENKDRSDRRLLFAAGVYLHAIDAGSGKLITSFGKDGRVDLREGLGRDPLSVVQIGFNSPGRTFENLLIVGSRPGEAYTAAPGDIRAYDVRTGKLAWTFHTIPHPGEFGYETWPQNAWKTSGAANVWADLTLDEKRGIIYAPTGSPTYDFYGADRKGANLFGDCLLALDARTGKRLWHFQTVHHDLWDYDNPSAPQLITVRHAGKMVDAVALAGKTGFLYVFDRVTGTPLWPIEERPVPRSDTPGEQAWPTQPFPTQPPPFARQSLTAKDVNPYIENASERAALVDRIQSARNEGLFTPPGTRETIQIPGGQGGANWGTTAADPAMGIVYVLSKDQPSILKLEQAPPRTGSQSGSPEQIGQRTYRQRCQACHGTELEGRPPEIPSLVGVTKRLDVAAIKRTVILGRGSMPAFDVADPELNALVAYFKNPAAGAPTWPVAPPAGDSAPPKQAKQSGPVRYWSGYGFMTSSVGSVISPPWSTMTAYDLNAGTIKWQVALGDEPALAARGIKNTGSGSPRGAVVTAGELIFSGTLDRKIRAFDKDTGKTLWEKELPIVPLSVAATYEVGGKQYVVIAGSPSARGAESAYIVFALPGAVK